MIEKIKKSWREFKGSEPGCRFQDRYNRRQQQKRGRWDLKSVINIVLGAAIALGGIVLLPAPGPGWLVIFFGLGMLGSEFAPIARALDWTELKLRAAWRWAKGVWQRSSLLVKVLIVLLALACLGALGYGLYLLLAG